MRSESKGRDHTFGVVSYFSFFYRVLLKREQNVDHTLFTNHRSGWRFNSAQAFVPLRSHC